MPGVFERDGIRFQYPENWSLETGDAESGWTVSLQSPDTAFLMLTYDESMPEPEEMARTALEALQGEYKDLEAEDALETVAAQPAVGHDIRFFSFDLTNTCVVRSFYSGAGTVLLLWQLNDLESETNEPVLRAICASLRVEED
ncbi:MAG: hypothetical protein U0793_02730 [Gemmataceae bacterium]